MTLQKDGTPTIVIGHHYENDIAKGWHSNNCYRTPSREWHCKRMALQQLGQWGEWHCNRMALQQLGQWGGTSDTITTMTLQKDSTIATGTMRRDKWHCKRMALQQLGQWGGTSDTIATMTLQKDSTTTTGTMGRDKQNRHETMTLQHDSIIAIGTMKRDK